MSARHRSASRVAAVAAFLAVAIACAVAFARPGGGDSYGGGGGGGGGGGSSGGGGGGAGIELLFVVIQIAFEYPVIGVPLLILLLIVGIWAMVAKSRAPTGWTAGADDDYAGRSVVAAARVQERREGPSGAKQLEALRTFDPNYSQVLFEDFLYALYAEVHRARGAGELEALSAYVTPQAAASLLQPLGMTAVTGVVIGSMSIRSASGITPQSPGATVTVAFESNYVEVVNGAENTYWAEETWTLFRKLDTPSRTPQRARTIACPKCGAPLTSSTLRGGTCSYCQTHVGTGEFDWLVKEVRVDGRRPRAPQLTAEVAEIGTDWPTVVDPDAKERFAALCQRDPAFGWPAFEARVKQIHHELNEGWGALDWMRVRPYVTDNLFQQQVFWIDAYRKQKLRNRLDGARVLAVEAARVTSDAFYDAITVRVHATGLDYVVREGGGIVRGSDTEERRYTEYWTLIRGVASKGPSRTDPACPRCGAPLKINQFGACEYCQAKVTTGDFDWVLSRIEQDEAYSG